MLRHYDRRAKTRTEHLRLVAQYRGWRVPTSLELCYAWPGPMLA